MKKSSVVCVVLLAAVILAGLMYIADCLWIGSTIRALVREIDAGGGEYTQGLAAYVSEESFYGTDLPYLGLYEGEDDSRPAAVIPSAHCFTKGVAFYRAGGVVVTVWLEFHDGRWYATDAYAS